MGSPLSKKSGAILVAVLLALTAFPVATAQALFPDHFLETDVNARFIALGDFNEDGQVDMVVPVIATGDEDLLLFFGLGGDFVPGGRLPTAGIPDSIAVGDYNEDGHDDIAVNFPVADSVTIHLGFGDGTFAQPTSIDVFDYPAHVAAADCNGDGHLDLILPIGTPSAIKVLQGDGDGTFAPQAPVPSPSGQFLIADDFDDDGNTDLALATGGSSTESIFILLGTGGCGFAAATEYSLDGTWPIEIVSADFNLDGHRDLVVANFLAGADVSVLLGVGDGTFVPGPAFTPTQVGYLYSIAVGRFDQDGFVDLVFAYEDVADLYLGAGDGSFVPYVRFNAGRRFWFVTAADFDGDSIDDVALADDTLGELSIHLGAGDGTFRDTEEFDVGELPRAVAAGDLNGDGFDDLTVGNATSGDISILLNDGDGTFATEQRIPLGASPWAVAIGDLDGDGLNDLVAANSDADPGGVSVFLGLGDGSFDPQVDYGTGLGPVAIILADLNADDIVDLATANVSSDSISVLLGLGGGAYAPEMRLAAGDGPTALAVADFNLDGRADLAAANVVSDDVSVLLGDGQGGFAAPAQFGASGSARGVAVGDFGTDGLPDLAVTTVQPSGLDILHGRGDGSFEAPTPYIVTDGNGIPDSLVVADFNADSMDDVALTLLFDHEIVVLPGRDDGAFESRRHYQVVSGNPLTATCPYAMVFGDFDRDGLDDLATANRCTDDVTIFLNLGTPALRARAGSDVVQHCESAVGATVMLDGSSSTAPASTPGTNDDIVLFEWFEDLGEPSEAFLGTGETLAVSLSFGAHKMTLRVTDSAANSATDLTFATVVDSTPPAMSIAVQPSLLWPPNHRLVDVSAMVETSDACGSVSLELLSIVADEPDDVPGDSDGRTVGDIAGVTPGTADTGFQLRAERDAEGAGRTYSVTYRATDDAGNEASTLELVAVPHDVGGITEPLVISLQDGPAGTALFWDAVPGALHYSVVRGEVGNLIEEPGFINLGPLTCIAASTEQIDTTGHEDSDIPPAGEAYFYLVESNDGLPSGYGTESAPLDRLPPPGQSGCPIF